MISIDDYHQLNGLIAQMILKYKLQKETIFFIDFREYEAKDQIKTLSDLGFIIGSHTMTHAFLNEVPPERAKWELEESKTQLEAITGQTIEWISYPRGRYSDDILKLAKEVGYKYGRTTKLTDGKTDLEKGGLHLSYLRKEYEGKDPFTLVEDYTHFWGHTKEFIEFNLTDKLEEFLKWYKCNLK